MERGGRGTLQGAHPATVRTPGASILFERAAVGRWCDRSRRYAHRIGTGIVSGAQCAGGKDAIRRVPDVRRRISLKLKPCLRSRLFWPLASSPLPPSPPPPPPSSRVR